MLEQNIRKFLNEWMEGKDFFLVDILVSKDHRIGIFMDKLTGIGVEDCKRISRYLEERLEAENLVPEKYLLEVSSPGADAVFKVREQYLKSINHEVEFTKIDGLAGEGLVLAVSDEYITLKAKVRNESKKWETLEINLPFNEIKSIKRKLIFK